MCVIELNRMVWLAFTVDSTPGFRTDIPFITSHCSQADENGFALLAKLISAIFREVPGFFLFYRSAFKWHMMCYAWIPSQWVRMMKLNWQTQNETKYPCAIVLWNSILKNAEWKGKQRFGFIHVRTIRGWKQLKWRHAFQNMVLMARACLLTHSLTHSLVHVSSCIDVFRLFQIRKSGTCTKSIQWQNKTMTTWCRKWNETKPKFYLYYYDTHTNTQEIW